MAYMELNELTKNYGTVIAADHVSLSVSQGEFLTLLGPSGSGKTTPLDASAFQPLTHTIPL